MDKHMCQLRCDSAVMQQLSTEAITQLCSYSRRVGTCLAQLLSKAQPTLVGVN